MNNHEKMNEDVWKLIETNYDISKKDKIKLGFKRIIQNIKNSDKIHKERICNICGLTPKEHNDNEKIRHTFLLATHFDKCIDCNCFYFQHSHKDNMCMYKPFRNQRSFLKKKHIQNINNGIYEPPNPNFIH